MIDSHILIVDDDPGIREPLKEYIQQAGYETSAISNAEEAMELLESNTVTVVITDISLPGMDGLEFTDQIKKNSMWMSSS